MTSLANGEPRHGAAVAHRLVVVWYRVKLARTADFDETVAVHGDAICEGQAK